MGGPAAAYPFAQMHFVVVVCSSFVVNGFKSFTSCHGQPISTACHTLSHLHLRCHPPASHGALHLLDLVLRLHATTTTATSDPRPNR